MSSETRQGSESSVPGGLRGLLGLGPGLGTLTDDEHAHRDEVNGSRLSLGLGFMIIPIAGGLYDSLFADILCIVGLHGVSVRRRAALSPPRWLSMEPAPNVKTHLGERVSSW